MPQRLNLQPIRTCPRRKVRYYSKMEAETGIEIMRRFYDDMTYKDTSRLRAYRCDICQAWHFGDPDRLEQEG